MISPSKIFLELLLLVGVILLLRTQGKPIHRTFVLWFVGVCVVLNILFYYLAAWAMYASFGQSQGIAGSTLHLMVWFDIVKWGVLAYFLSRFAVEVPDQLQAGGFHLLRSERSRWVILVAGILGGLITTAFAYAVSYAEVYLHILDAVPWGYFKENDMYFSLGLWGGLRNLAGEEILTRLGVQSVLLYLLRKNKLAPVWALLGSSLYFEFWHNGFRDLYFLNFSASLVFGWVYHKYGYESAAVSHCLSDWLILIIVPRLMF